MTPYLPYVFASLAILVVTIFYRLICRNSEITLPARLAIFLALSALVAAGTFLYPIPRPALYLFAQLVGGSLFVIYAKSAGTPTLVYIVLAIVCVALGAATSRACDELLPAPMLFGLFAPLLRPRASLLMWLGMLVLYFSPLIVLAQECATASAVPMLAGSAILFALTSAIVSLRLKWIEPVKKKSRR